MEKVRKYGQSPFRVAVLHGGPGASGEMTPVARELAFDRGVLEPLQTAGSLDGQVEELKTVLETTADQPAVLIGYSWGAWLGFIVAGRYPTCVKKLVLVSGGPFEDSYAARIEETRFSRLNDEERAEVRSLVKILEDPAAQNKSEALARFGALFSKADAFDPFPDESEAVNCRPDIFIFERIWKEASELRRGGKLLELGKLIQCPVVAIHGDYDPHPAQGVLQPLSAVLKDFRFILLENCGHKPWMERRARDEFYRILKGEMIPTSV